MHGHWFHDHDPNTDNKRQLSNLRKGTEVMKEGIWPGFFPAAYQNGDQFYDIGPLCPNRMTQNSW